MTIFSMLLSVVLSRSFSNLSLPEVSILNFPTSFLRLRMSDFPRVISPSFFSVKELVFFPVPLLLASG